MNKPSSDANSEVQATIEQALALGSLSGEALRTWLYKAAEAGFKSALSAAPPSKDSVALELLRRVAEYEDDETTGPWPAVHKYLASVQNDIPANRAKSPGVHTMRPDQVVEWAIGVLRGIVERHPEVLHDCDVESFIADQLQPTLDDMRAVQSERGQPDTAKVPEAHWMICKVCKSRCMSNALAYRVCEGDGTLDCAFEAAPSSGDSREEGGKK